MPDEELARLKAERDAAEDERDDAQAVARDFADALDEMLNTENLTGGGWHQRPSPVIRNTATSLFGEPRRIAAGTARRTLNATRGGARTMEDGEVRFAGRAGVPAPRRPAPETPARHRHAPPRNRPAQCRAFRGTRRRTPYRQPIHRHQQADPHQRVARRQHAIIRQPRHPANRYEHRHDTKRHRHDTTRAPARPAPAAS